MHWQKFRATQLFDGYTFQPEDSVLITDARGIVEAIVPSGEAGEDVQNVEGLLCPGLVNAHCHLELSHLRGMIPQHTGMIDFLLSVMRLRNFTPETIHTAMQEAITTILQNGIVAVGDICNTSDSIKIKHDSPLRWQNFIEVTGFVGADAGNRFAKAHDVFRLFEASFPGRNTIVPHAPYSVSPQLFSLVNDSGEGRLQSMHSQESVEENRFYKDKTGNFLRLYETLGINIGFFKPAGTTSLKACLPRLNKAGQLILVHNVAVEDHDLEEISPSVFFCLCPNANQYIQDTMPPVDMLRPHSNRICLGTDSLASNNQLSILAEVRTLLAHYPHLHSAEVLRWATLNGAKALQLDQTLGSFEKGKTPGAVLITGNLTSDTTVQRII